MKAASCHTSWRLWKIAVITVITSCCPCFGREALLITEKMFAVCLPARTGWNNIFPCHCEAPQTGCCLRCVDSNPGWTVLVICLISLISHSVHTKYELRRRVRVVWGTGVLAVAEMPLECADTGMAARLHQITFLFLFGGKLCRYLLAAVNKTRWNKICAFICLQASLSAILPPIHFYNLSHFT